MLGCLEKRDKNLIETEKGVHNLIVRHTLSANSYTALFLQNALTTGFLNTDFTHRVTAVTFRKLRYNAIFGYEQTDLYNSTILP